jgi:argininosuccinate lyase
VDDKYKYLFTVDDVNKLVMQGISFRDAYKIVGQKVVDGSYTPSPLTEAGRGHHEGSIGNLCNEEIKKQMDRIVSSFPFTSVHTALGELLKP